MIPLHTLFHCTCGTFVVVIALRKEDLQLDFLKKECEDHSCLIYFLLLMDSLRYGHRQQWVYKW